MTGGDFIGIALEFTFFGVFIWYMIWTTKARARLSSKADVITLPNGHNYPYVIGNYLSSEQGFFRGGQLRLPKPILSMYVDAHTGDRGRGMLRYVSPERTVSLEGDFNKYFSVYIPKNSQVLALSILTPDVMQTLISASNRFDVAFGDEYLNVIAHDRPYHVYE